MIFNPKTATQEEFETEARRLHAGRLHRIQNMTPEEQQACAMFMMDGYLQRAATLRINEIFSVEDLELQINKCVDIWRIDNFQNSDEYEQERQRLVAADRARAADLAAERVRLRLQEDASDAEVAQARQDALREERLENDRRLREIRRAEADAERERRRQAEVAREVMERSESLRLAEEDAARVKREFAEKHKRPSPEPYREPETALTFEHWLSLGRPNVISVPGSLPNKFRYPEGATDVEMWDFYSTKADFLQSGYSWNSPEGRRLGEEHNAVKRRIEQAAYVRKMTGEVPTNLDEVPGDMEDLLEDIDEAIGFQRNRGNPAKVTMWERIRDAVESGNVPDEVRDRVRHGYSGARPSGRFYHVWKGAYHAIIGDKDEWQREVGT